MIPMEVYGNQNDLNAKHNIRIISHGHHVFIIGLLWLE